MKGIMVFVMNYTSIINSPMIIMRKLQGIIRRPKKQHQKTGDFLKDLSETMAAPGNKKSI